MVTGTASSASKSSTVRAEMDTHLSDVLTPEIIDELRTRVDKPAETPIFNLLKGFALLLWRSVEAFDAWLGGSPSTQRERQRLVLAHIEPITKFRKLVI